MARAGLTGLAALLSTIGATRAQQGPADLRPPQTALTFDDSVIGAPGSGQRAELFKPAGAGPFPVVLVLHGCNGVSPNIRRWARRVTDWGYAALVVDSFKPRGIENVCGTPGVVSPRLRAADAFAAAAYLRTRSDIDASKIAVVGFSHGGSTALAAATRIALERLGGRPFSAVVSFYPWCWERGAPIASDVLTLIGDADDWTPAERCVNLSARWEPGFGSFRLKIYPGAKHSFDSAAPDRVYFGYRLGYDPAATADSIEETRRFIAERFGR